MGVSEKRIRNILTIIYAKLDIHESKGMYPRVAIVIRGKELGLLPQDLIG